VNSPRAEAFSLMKVKRSRRVAVGKAITKVVSPSRSRQLTVLSSTIDAAELGSASWAREIAFSRPSGVIHSIWTEAFFTAGLSAARGDGSRPAPNRPMDKTAVGRPAIENDRRPMQSGESLDRAKPRMFKATFHADRREVQNGLGEKRKPNFACLAGSFFYKRNIEKPRNPITDRDVDLNRKRVFSPRARGSRLNSSRQGRWYYNC
jgi:hypothetical protein